VWYNPGMKQAIIYTRVSTEDQAEQGVSLEAQESKARTWAELNGYTVGGVHVDAGISGKRADRPGLIAALDACREGDALVVYSLSRLSRSTRDTMDIADRLDRTGADLVSLTERIDTTTAAGKMVFRLLAVLAEFERDLISERVTGALHHLKAQGRAYNHPPLGFDRQGDELVPNADELATVRRIRAWRDRGVSLHQIAHRLNDAGAPTKRGGAWYASTILAVLRNDLHAA